MNASEVVSRVRFYGQARRDIQNDRNLSEQGKARAGGNLEQSIQLFRQQAHDALKREWAEMRVRYYETQALRLRCEQLAGARWDYNRLLFETGSVERTLAGFRDLKDVTSWLEKELTSGNPEHARAVAEVAPAFLRKRFPGVNESEGGGEHAARACERKLAGMLSTPELEKVNELESEGGQAVLRLVTATEEVSSFFSPDGLMWGENEFTRLLSNVKVSRTYHPDELSRFERTSIEFTPEPEPAGA